MGFLEPDLPVVDMAEWSKGTRSERIRPMARHWAEVGFGTPVALHLFYVGKVCLYVLGGWLIMLATKGIDGFANVDGMERLLGFLPATRGGGFPPSQVGFPASSATAAPTTAGLVLHRLHRQTPPARRPKYSSQR